MLSQFVTLKARGRDKRGVSSRGHGRAAWQRKAATGQRERHRLPAGAAMRGPTATGGARSTMNASGFGLFDPALEKDSCGVGFIADIKGRKSHKIVEDALTILVNLEHRGAVGADPRAGDGAGILVQLPHKFIAKKAAEIGIKLPPPGHYAVGALFMPHEDDWRQEIMDTYAAIAAQEGMMLLGWRDVPTNNSTLGETVKPTEPVNKQVFLARGANIESEDEFERRLYILRKTISQRLYTA